MFLENIITAFFIFLIVYEIYTQLFAPKLREGADGSNACSECPHCPTLATTLPETANEALKNSTDIGKINASLQVIQSQLTALQMKPVNKAKDQKAAIENKVNSPPPPSPPTPSIF